MQDNQLPQSHDQNQSREYVHTRRCSNSIGSIKSRLCITQKYTFAGCLYWGGEKNEKVEVTRGRGIKEREDECSSSESVWLRSNNCHGFKMFPWKCYLPIKWIWGGSLQQVGRKVRVTWEKGTTGAEREGNKENEEAASLAFPVQQSLMGEWRGEFRGRI